MEAGLLTYGIAACTAFICASCAVLVVTRAYWHRVANAKALHADDPSTAMIAWRLRKGYGWIKPTASLLLRNNRIAHLTQQALFLVELRGYTTTSESLLSVFLGVVLAIGVASCLAFRSVIVGAALDLCIVAGTAMSITSTCDKRKDAIRDAVPQALEAMQSCFSAGFTLLQTFQQIAHDIDGPLGDLFARSAHVLETGGTAEQALSALKRETDASELAFVAVALDVQHQSGGALRQVLQAAIDTVKGELALRSALRVQTAQAKLSARVVAIMPLILVAAFSLASPDYLLPFFSSPIGLALFALAVVMQLTGLALVRRALSVQGVTR